MNDADYEQAVNSFYEALYAFAYSLVRNENDACELTQETFARLLTKGEQVRDRSKLKGWLFTTLYRQFLGWKNREARFPHLEISTAEHELPAITPEIVDSFENDAIRQALFGIEERYRAPLMLYYLEGHSYAEIAVVLDIPIGTVMSRLSRGKALMRQSLASLGAGAPPKILPLEQQSKPEQS